VCHDARTALSLSHSLGVLSRLPECLLAVLPSAFSIPAGRAGNSNWVAEDRCDGGVSGNVLAAHGQHAPAGE
jgi:hypothetical protein